MIVGVTGVSGQLGRLVVTALQESGIDPVKFSRTKQDAGTRPGDFERPETLDFTGIDRLLIISTLGAKDTVAAHKVAFEAAARAGVGRVVYTSVQNPRLDNPFPAAAVHVRGEADLRAAGVPFTILRNALYADLRAELAPNYARDGRWVTNLGAGSHAFVSRADCAAAAAAALTADGLEGRTFEITGPALLTADQYLDLVREKHPTPINRIDADDATYDKYRAAFTADPANAGTFELFTGSGRAIREGFLAVLGAGVKALTGHDPRHLRTLL